MDTIFNFFYVKTNIPKKYSFKGEMFQQKNSVKKISAKRSLKQTIESFYRIVNVTLQIFEQFIRFFVG